jgi:hypothetical protein
MFMKQLPLTRNPILLRLQCIYLTKSDADELKALLVSAKTQRLNPQRQACVGTEGWAKQWGGIELYPARPVKQLELVLTFHRTVLELVPVPMDTEVPTRKARVGKSGKFAGATIA